MSVSRRRLLIAGALGLSWTPFGLVSCGDGSVPVDPPVDGGSNTTDPANTTTPTNTVVPSGDNTTGGGGDGGNTTPSDGNNTGGGGVTPPPGPTPPAPGPRIRYDIRSTQGQAMLAIYAKGVAAMMALPESDPRSWTFWWYTHFIRDDRSKTQELTRVFGAASTPAKVLANKVWDTCQAHIDDKAKFYFLPWHRMFVLAFENVIRQVTGEAGFTLPYWSYTDAGNAALPAQFRRQGDATWGALYRPNRNPGVNNGSPIQPGGVLTLDIMNEPTYAIDGADQGFCVNIDGQLHGHVHTGVGDIETGMGVIAWAASDPIFWVHHCNIDRVWASWNAGGGVNPTDSDFVSKPFAFAGPNGAEVDYTVGKMLSTASAGYAYDKLERAPGGGEAVEAQGAVGPAASTRSARRSSPLVRSAPPLGAGSPTISAAATSRLQGVVATPTITHVAQAIRLGSAPVRVRLGQAATQTSAVAQALPPGSAVLRGARRAAPVIVGAAAPSVRAGASPAPPAAAPSAAVAAPAQTLPAPGPGQRALLVLNGIETNTQPGVVFGVFLVAPKGQKSQVGVLSFFSSMGAMPGMTMGNAGAGRAVSFDITALAKRLAASGQLEAQPQLSFEPLGGRTVKAGASPTVRSVSLAIQ